MKMDVPCVPNFGNCGDKHEDEANKVICTFDTENKKGNWSKENQLKDKRISPLDN